MKRNGHFVHQLRFPEGGAIGTFPGVSMNLFILLTAYAKPTHSLTYMYIYVKAKRIYHQNLSQMELSEYIRKSTVIASL